MKVCRFFLFLRTVTVQLNLDIPWPQETEVEGEYLDITDRRKVTVHFTEALSFLGGLALQCVFYSDMGDSSAVSKGASLLLTCSFKCFLCSIKKKNLEFRGKSCLFQTRSHLKTSTDCFLFKIF